MPSGVVKLVNSDFNNDLLDYLKSRRSDLAMTLVEPAPTADEVAQLITLAARVPDHGKLSPWRFIEYPHAARQKLCDNLKALSDKDADETRIESREKEISRFKSAPMVIGVVSCAAEHPKIPQWEQALSAGAATMQMLIAANAMGFGAQWLTGWYTRDSNALALLGITGGEQVAGMVHIGTPTAEKTDRTRPELSDIHSIYSSSR